MQNSKLNEDLRIRRTRKLLQQALIDLTVEKGFAAVTIRDISERAMVNRSTFYRHYLDKYDLLEQYLDEVRAIVSDDDAAGDASGDAAGNASWNTAGNGDAHRKPVQPPLVLVRLLHHVQSLADFYRIMLGQNGDQMFTMRFREIIEARFRYLIAMFGRNPDDPHTPPIDLRLTYISCADIGAILWWLENDQPFSVEQLAVWISQLAIANAGFRTRREPEAALPT